MTDTVFVSFASSLVDGVESMVPEFSAPSNYKDPEKIAAYIEHKKDDFLSKAATSPYTGTVNDVSAAYFDNDGDLRVDRFTSSASATAGLQFFHKMSGIYPGEWTSDVGNNAGNVYFIGIDVGLMLKMIGLEVATMLPNVERPNLGFWYGNSNHRDMTTAVMPTPYCSDMGWGDVFRLYGLDKLDTLSGWSSPHVDSKLDLILTIELAGRLGMINEPAREQRG